MEYKSSRMKPFLSSFAPNPWGAAEFYEFLPFNGSAMHNDIHAQ